MILGTSNTCVLSENSKANIGSHSLHVVFNSSCALEAREKGERHVEVGNSALAYIAQYIALCPTT